MTGTSSFLRIAEITNNANLLLLGSPGSGKTTALRKIAKSIVEEGGAVLMISFNGTQTIMEESEAVKRIKAKKETIPLSVLSPIRGPDGSLEEIEDVTESVVDIFCDVSPLKVRQKAALRNAVIEALKSPDSFSDEMKAIGDKLGSDEAEKSVFERFRQVFKQVKVCAGGKFIDTGRITILDLDGYSPYTQRMMAQMVMSIIWRYFRACGQYAKAPLYLVLDEFQALSLRPDSVFCQILREGRKFNLSVLLATQTIDTFEKQVQAVIRQIGTKLYFSPDSEEILDILKKNQVDTKAMRKLLLNLKKGECVAFGRFELGEQMIERPMKLSFWYED